MIGDAKRMSKSAFLAECVDWLPKQKKYQDRWMLSENWFNLCQENFIFPTHMHPEKKDLGRALRNKFDKNGTMIATWNPNSQI